MKRDHLIGVWLSKPLFDHIDTQATNVGISRPAAIRKILLSEYINTQATKAGLTAQQYIAQLIQGGHVGHLDQKLIEELIANANSKTREVTDGQHQHSSKSNCK